MIGQTADLAVPALPTHPLRFECARVVGRWHPQSFRIPWSRIHGQTTHRRCDSDDKLKTMQRYGLPHHTDITRRATAGCAGNFFDDAHLVIALTCRQFEMRGSFATGDPRRSQTKKTDSISFTGGENHDEETSASNLHHGHLVRVSGSGRLLLEWRRTIWQFRRYRRLRRHQRERWRCRFWWTHKLLGWRHRRRRRDERWRSDRRGWSYERRRRSRLRNHGRGMLHGTYVHLGRGHLPRCRRQCSLSGHARRRRRSRCLRIILPSLLRGQHLHRHGRHLSGPRRRRRFPLHTRWPRYC